MCEKGRIHHRDPSQTSVTWFTLQSSDVFSSPGHPALLWWRLPWGDTTVRIHSILHPSRNDSEILPRMIVFLSSPGKKSHVAFLNFPLSLVPGLKLVESVQNVQRMCSAECTRKPGSWCFACVLGFSASPKFPSSQNHQFHNPRSRLVKPLDRTATNTSGLSFSGERSSPNCGGDWGCMSHGQSWLWQGTALIDKIWEMLSWYGASNGQSLPKFLFKF